MNGKKSENIVNIDGKEDLNEIITIFDDKYKLILNNPECQTSANESVPRSEAAGGSLPLITSDDIDLAIYDLNSGVGWDGYHSNHFKFAGIVFRNLLGKFLNKLLDHCYVPKNMSHGEIRPIFKGKKLDKNSSLNYRPVMNSCMSLKILEYCLLPSMTKCLRLNNLQFGFRKKVGCLSAITLVKETVFKYNNENSNVHCAMIDLSKAFDCVNKNILFAKLRKSSLNLKIIDLLQFMYSNTSVNILFNGIKGHNWDIGNGVRQGGILSPLLYGFYTNDILESISSMNDGCSLNGYKTNIIAYADDLLLMSPTVKGLQLMQDNLQILLKDLCFKIADKSKYLIFKHKNYKTQEYNPKILLDGAVLYDVNECIYLGVILNGSHDVGSDIDRRLSSFLKQFNGMYSKFNFAHNNVLFFLFKAYTSSFYGLEVIHDRIPKFLLNRISVAYHKAIKKIANLNTWDSNHEACETVGVLLFKHLIAKRQLCFWYNLCNSASPCLANLKYYFRTKSHVFMILQNLFRNNYSVNISREPLCAILARINFVQRTEPRSNYVYVADS